MKVLSSAHVYIFLHRHLYFPSLLPIGFMLYCRWRNCIKLIARTCPELAPTQSDTVSHMTQSCWPQKREQRVRTSLPAGFLNQLCGAWSNCRSLRRILTALSPMRCTDRRPHKTPWDINWNSIFLKSSAYYIILKLYFVLQIQYAVGPLWGNEKCRAPWSWEWIFFWK